MDTHQCIYSSRQKRYISKNGLDTTNYASDDWFCIECNVYYNHAVYLENGKIKSTYKKQTPWSKVEIEKSVISELICACASIARGNKVINFCGVCKKLPKGATDVKKECKKCNKLLYLNHFRINKPECRVCEKEFSNTNRLKNLNLEKKGKKICLMCKQEKIIKEFPFKTKKGTSREPKCAACINGLKTGKKTCSKCKQVKDFSDFHDDNANSHKKRSACISCCKLDTHRRKNTPTSNNYISYVEGKSDFKEEWGGDEKTFRRIFLSIGMRLYDNQVDVDSFISLNCNRDRKYDRERFGSKMLKNIPLITKEEIHDLITKQDNKCAYTGIELQWNRFAPNQLKASIDRIDSSKPHTISNCQLTTYYMNHKKGKFSDKKFRNSDDFKAHKKICIHFYKKYLNYTSRVIIPKSIDINDPFMYPNHTDNSYSFAIFVANGIKKYEDQYYRKNYFSRLISAAKYMDQRKFGNDRLTINDNELTELIKKQDNKCALTGVELQWSRTAPGVIRASIDRINNDEPHTAENCHITASYLNMMRREEDLDAFKHSMKFIKCSQKIEAFCEEFKDPVEFPEPESPEMIFTKKEEPEEPTKHEEEHPELELLMKRLYEVIELKDRLQDLPPIYYKKLIEHLELMRPAFYHECTSEVISEEDEEKLNRLKVRNSQPSSILD